MCSVEVVLKKKKMSTSSAPCAACKCLRRKCTNDCVFAPYFPADDPTKFTNVHKVYGASNVAKLLKELSDNQRKEAVKSLAYEAEYRLREPVHGCVGLVAFLQQKLKQVHHDLECAKQELSTYIVPSAMLPQQQPQQNFGSSVYQMMPYHVQQMMFPTGAPHGGQLVIREPNLQEQQHQQQQVLETQQLAAMAAATEREMLRAYEQQQLQHQQQQQQQDQEMLRAYEQQELQHQQQQQQEQDLLRAYEQQLQHQQQLQQQQGHDLVRFNDVFDDAGGPSNATGFNEMPEETAAAEADGMQPLWALGGSHESNPYHHIQQHDHAQERTLFPPHPHTDHPDQLQLVEAEELFLQQHEQQQQGVITHHHLQQTPQQLAQPQTSHSHQQFQRDKNDDGRSIGPSC